MPSHKAGMHEDITIMPDGTTSIFFIVDINEQIQPFEKCFPFTSVPAHV